MLHFRIISHFTGSNKVRAQISENFYETSAENF